MQEKEKEKERERERERETGVARPSFGKASSDEHRDCAACDQTGLRCVPRQVHDKLSKSLAPKHGGDRAAAGAALLAWYPAIWATLPSDFVTGDRFKFWQVRFDEAFASQAAASPNNVRPPNCRHTPPCVDEVACTQRRKAARYASGPMPVGRPS